MANLSSGKRPGDRDVDDARGRVAAGDRDRNGHGHGGESGRQAKRTRRESPEKGDWRDVHFKENERERDRDRNRDRSGYSSRRDREDYRRYDRSSRRGDHKTGGREQERWSRSRSRTRSRSKSLLVNTEPPLNYGEDDEKEEGEISPRPIPPAPPSAGLQPSKAHGDRGPAHSPSTSRRRSDYPSSRRSRSRSETRRARTHQEEGRYDRPRRERADADIEMRDVTRVIDDREPGEHAREAKNKNENEQDTKAEVAAEPEPAPEEEKSIEELMEERRKRRAAILAKHASGQSSDNLGLSARAATPITTTTTTAAAESALGTPSAAVGAAFAKVSLASEAGSRRPSVPPLTPSESMSQVPTRIGTASPAPLTAGLGGTFALAKEDDDGIKANESAEVRKGEQVKAADYDPSLDRREDEKKRFHPDEAMVVDDAGEEEEVEVTDDEGEEEDVDDMFALAMGDEEEEGKKEKKVGKKKKVVKRKKAPTALANTAVTVDSAADPEGYYTIILGEYLDGGRYQVYSSLGKGMFANVVRARVLRDEFGREIDPAAAAAQGGFRDVAIKIVRCQEAMYKAGLKEAQILQKLRNMDLEDKKHVVRLERTFEHRGHLCLVFENLSMNLREVVKRFGKDVGLNIRAVRAYANQLFLALSLLKKANVMHADIKPDNILVNEQKNLLKLCDLGSASDASENEVTPYLVSRFYRAPEIILGVPYDPSLDIWSVGCTLYELYTGKILFPGKSNAHMLMLMMEVKGRFNQKMIKRARFGERYFDGLGNLLEDVIKDVGVGVGGVGVGGVGKLGGGAGGGVKGKDLRSRIVGASGSMGEEEGRLVGAFVDLLEKCLVLDPGRRITPREALGHAFVRG